MEFSWPQSFFNHPHHFSSFSMFSSYLIVIIILLILLLILRQLGRETRVWCNCEICETYIKSGWAVHFPNLCDWYVHLLRKSPTRTVHIHVLNNTITANPENVEYMLKSNFHNFPKGKPFSTILGDLLGRGIFNVDGDLWMFQRKMASHELGRVSIRAYAFEVVIQEINRRLMPLMESVSQGKEEIDLQDVFRRFSFDCICRFSFGLDPKCLEISLPLSEFAVAFDLASRLSAERAMTASPLEWKIKRLLNIGSEKKLRKAIKTIDMLAREVIRQKRKSGFSHQKDLLSRFMASTTDDTYLRDIIVSFLLAGRDTVASALTSFFWVVAHHPEVEVDILQEADKVIGSNFQGLASHEELGELHYLHASLYESMRLYPPIQFDSKFCEDDDVLADGSFVRKGTRVTYHPYAMGRMEEIWGSDCLDFKPERWLKEAGVFFPQNPFKYPVFQAGLRVCLGKEMALVELKIVAISLLRHFHFELVRSPETPRFSPGLTATFRDGFPVLVRARRGEVNNL